MEQTPFSNPVAALLIAASLVVAATPARAQAIGGAELRMAELEKAFWACDHAATVGRIDSGTAITCGGLTEALKVRKFDGDFNAMLAWWRQHKQAEHLALEEAAHRHALARAAGQQR